MMMIISMYAQNAGTSSRLQKKKFGNRSLFQLAISGRSGLPRVLHQNDASRTTAQNAMSFAHIVRPVFVGIRQRMEVICISAMSA